MLARITRSLIAFGVVFIAYQAYALMVVPLIEPAGGVRAASGPVLSPPTKSPVVKYQQLLAAYFPAQHWTLTGKPKVIETGQVMLVIEDYLRDNRGRVDFTRCAIVAFPTPRQRGGSAPRDAVIIEAPGGAKLQFDEDFNPSRGRVGRFVRGLFPGEIIIRSDMREPGPDDNLLIRTRDLQMNETRIVTQSDVEFQLGGNRGSGRNMEIILLEEEHQRPGSGGLAFNGVKHLEIFQVDKLELDVGRLDGGGGPLAAQVGRPPGGTRLTSHLVRLGNNSGADAWAGGNSQPSAYDAPKKAAGTARPAPPLEITCDGPFLLSFLDFTATFRDNVVATQLSLTGQSDQLGCQELRVRFSDKEDQLSPQDDPDLAGHQRSVLGKLRPAMLEAVGEPVRLDSPSRSAFARASNVRLDLVTRRLTLEGGAPTLVHGANEIAAPIIRYQHPAEGEPAAIGRLWLAGPGQIRVVPKPENPQETIDARWNAAPGVEFPVQLTRIEDRPVLLVEGRPQIAASHMGRLTSDRLRVAMREVPADGKEGPAIELGGSSNNQLALLPERFDAVGAVRIESPELDGRTSELTIWVRPEDKQPSLNDPRDAAGRRGGDDRPPQKTYTLAARKMEMDLLLHSRSATPSNLVCQGNVRFGEAPSGAGQASPLGVTGERLKINNLTSGAVVVRVDGAAGNGAQQAALAEIIAKGLTLRAATARLDQKSNRLWADGAGNAQVSVDRDLFGQNTGAATDLHLRWRGGLNFDGQKIVVREEVFGDAAHDWVRCDEVTATLTRPINFTRSPGGEEIEVAQIDCRGGVTIDHRGRDPQGQRSHEHAQLETLSLNQLSGEITGDGPGWVRSVRLAKSGGAFAALAPGDAKPQAGESGLEFLRVHFLRGISGNLNQRVINFHGDVQAIHGPVLAWEQELPLNPPGGLPPDTATLRCDTLTVNEDPLVGLTGRATPRADKGLGPIELHAQGGVQMQGAADGKGLFTAYAARASYSQSKGEFVLEGDKRSPATLYLQETAGSPRSPWQANNLTYWPASGRVKIGEFQQGSIGPSSATAPRPGPPRR